MSEERAPDAANEAEREDPQPAESPGPAESPAAAGERGPITRPAFARSFPKDAALELLVDAFARGDYRAVREGAPQLAASTTDEAVKRAALLLRERIEPDPSAKILFALAAGLLAFLTVWWLTHKGP